MIEAFPNGVGKNRQPSGNHSVIAPITSQKVKRVEPERSEHALQRKVREERLSILLPRERLT